MHSVSLETPTTPISHFSSGILVPRGIIRIVEIHSWRSLSAVPPRQLRKEQEKCQEFRSNSVLANEVETRESAVEQSVEE